MLRAFLFIFLIATLAVKSFAVEPVLDQQAMLYFNVSFDTGYKKKVAHDFGLRFDRGVIQPGEIMTIDQLTHRKPVFDLGINKLGIKTLVLNGIDFTDKYYVYHATEEEAEETETETTDMPNETTDVPKKKTKSFGKYIDQAPTGVLIGIVILTVALVDSTSSSK